MERPGWSAASRPEVKLSTWRPPYSGSRCRRRRRCFVGKSDQRPLKNSFKELPTTSKRKVPPLAETFAVANARVMTVYVHPNLGNRPIPVAAVRGPVKFLIERRALAGATRPVNRPAAAKGAARLQGNIGGVRNAIDEAKSQELSPCLCCHIGPIAYRFIPANAEEGIVGGPIEVIAKAEAPWWLPTPGRFCSSIGAVTGVDRDVATPV